MSKSELRIRRLPDLPTSPRGFAITIILGLMHHPWLCDRFGEEIAGLDLRNTLFARMLDHVTHAIMDHPDIGAEELGQQLAAQPDTERFARMAADSAFSRLSFLSEETPRDEVEEQFRDLLFRWRALPNLKKELLEIADDLSGATDAEYEQFVILQQQIANDGIEEAHEDMGDREAQAKLAETIARIRREKIVTHRGRRAGERR